MTAAVHRAPPIEAALPGASTPAPPIALYVHVPFCVSVCPYCDFVVYGGTPWRGPRPRVESYLEAVHAEIDLRADVLDDRHGPVGATATRELPAGSGARSVGTTAAGIEVRPALASVYIGGGTPSLLAARDVAALLDHVDRRMRIAPGAEITLEANPGPDERGDLRGLRVAGVNRLSVGAQSLQDGELRRLGRRHRPQDVAATCSIARAAGFGNVSIDLLTDVPGQRLQSWRATLDEVVALQPDHLSAYSLTIDDPDAEGLTGQTGDHLPLRPGARAWRARAALEQDADRAADMDEITGMVLEAAGLLRYEIANHARPGAESRHNLAYWRRGPYEAVGPGAHAFDGDLVRRWNAARLDRYVSALLPKAGGVRHLPPGGGEVLDRRTAAAERLILGLRLTAGVENVAVADASVAAGLRWATENGLTEHVADRIRLTARGRMLSNEVFQRLLPGDGAA